MYVRMYHVTNQSGDSPQPNWGEIRVHAANDRHYDGDMWGLPVACFTTTVFKGQPPDSSPYPRSARPGQEHWRVSVWTDLSKYNLLLLNSVGSQHHVLALKIEGWEAEVFELLRYRFPLAPRDAFFPDSRENEYRHTNFIVNLNFVSHVSLPLFLTRWEKVPKQDCGSGRLQEVPGSSTDEQLKAWLGAQLESTVRDLQQRYRAVISTL